MLLVKMRAVQRKGVSEMGWLGQLHLEVDRIRHILASVIRFYSQTKQDKNKNEDQISHQIAGKYCLRRPNSSLSATSAKEKGKKDECLLGKPLKILRRSRYFIYANLIPSLLLCASCISSDAFTRSIVPFTFGIRTSVQTYQVMSPRQLFPRVSRFFIRLCL